MISNNLLRGARGFGAAAALLLLASGAQAATFSIVGGHNAVLDTDFNPLNPTWNPASEFGITIGSHVKRFGSGNAGGGNGLFVSAAAPGFVVDLVYTYKGSEAAYRNLFDDALSFSSALFDNQAGSNAPGTLNGVSAGLVPLMFRSVGAGNKDAANGGAIDAALKLSFKVVNSGHTAYAFLEDIAKNGDKDFDDMAIRIDLYERCVENCRGDQTDFTPLPGAVWLLGTVLAGGAGVSRWRKRKAKNGSEGGGLGPNPP